MLHSSDGAAVGACTLFCSRIVRRYRPINIVSMMMHTFVLFQQMADALVDAFGHVEVILLAMSILILYVRVNYAENTQKEI